MDREEKREETMWNLNVRAMSNVHSGVVKASGNLPGAPSGKVAVSYPQHHGYGFVKL